MTHQFHSQVHTQRNWKHVHTETSTGIFTVVFFTTAKWWKQPKCPAIDECVNKMWYIHAIQPQKGSTDDTCYNMDEPWKHAQWKMPVTKNHIWGDLQDGGGVQRGAHLPLHKYIKSTSTCGTTPTEHLLNAGRRPQTSQKARKSPYTWVGQKKKEKTETKE